MFSFEDCFLNLLSDDEGHRWQQFYIRWLWQGIGFCEAKATGIESKRSKRQMFPKEILRALWVIGGNNFISGDYGKEVPPVPIPNTVVKLLRVDNTWRVTAWKSRSSPDPFWAILFLESLFFFPFFDFWSETRSFFAYCFFYQCVNFCFKTIGLIEMEFTTKARNFSRGASKKLV